MKFQRFTTSESKDIGIRKSDFVAKSQFLYLVNVYIEKAQAMVEIVKQLGWTYVSTVAAQVLIKIKTMLQK